MQDINTAASKEEEDPESQEELNASSRSIRHCSGWIDAVGTL